MGDRDKYYKLEDSYPGVKRVHESPNVYVVNNFLEGSECDALIAFAKPRMRRSLTVSHSSAPRVHPSRTSHTCHISKLSCEGLIRKVCKLTGMPSERMELPQVASYVAGQLYHDHHDSVDPHTPSGKLFCANGGQRIATVLVYLNDVVEGGGCTAFPVLKMRVRPERGKAVIFFPSFSDGEVDTRLLHAGMPPLGSKWVAQIWIRQSKVIDGTPSRPRADDIEGTTTSSRPRACSVM